MRKFTSLLLLFVIAMTTSVQAQGSADEQPLEIVGITPAQGEVESLGEIVITFNQPVSPNGRTLYVEPVYGYVEFKYVEDSELSSNQLKFVADTPVTMLGKCLLRGYDINVKYGDSKTKNFSGTDFTWTIVETVTGIENVAGEVAGEEIYDITGRRVEAITKSGIYIVNGKKKLIK